MKNSEAVDLISGASLNYKNPVAWCDLGCGAGTFTYALASLLPQQSKIYAVDRSSQLLHKTAGNGVEIVFRKANFESEILPFSGLDGIIMANSLHYIAGKEDLIRRIKKYLSINGRFIIVEYDTLSANPWVPYPIDYVHLKQLFSKAGYSTIEKTGFRNSIYSPGVMYSCVIKP